MILLFFAIVFSVWFMWHTFSYKEGSMIVAAKVWSDFASHIPLIRSFSLGDNFPPINPLFSGESIRYHFLFYLLVGLLEKIGLPIDWALNIPSAFSLALLIVSIYLLTVLLFKKKAAGVISVLLFLFNGSLSFLEFFKNHTLSLKAIRDITTNLDYPSFAPYGPGIVSAFWNLNIYTNQRHFALPLAFLLLMTCWLINQNQSSSKSTILKSVGWGIFLGLLPLAHSSIFIMTVSILTFLFIFLSRQRVIIFIVGLVGLILALPRVFFLQETASFTPKINIGYLISDQLTLFHFLQYWFLNLGLFWILLPLGFLFSSKLAKKIFIAYFSLFIIGNLIQFSPEIAGNHKFFNVFVIVGNMFVAFALIRFWKLNLVKFTVPFLIFFLILSGIIDFFPLKNDSRLEIDDFPKNPDVTWIINNTPKDAVFLNSSYLYHPASMAGRKIFYGWPYFAWSLGYDTTNRASIVERLYNPKDIKEECSLLKDNHISYITTEETKDFNINYTFFEQNAKQIYKNPINSFIIYSTDNLCQTAQNNLDLSGRNGIIK